MNKLIYLSLALSILSCGDSSSKQETTNIDNPPITFVNDEAIAPSVDVTFPISSAKTDASSITVKGVANSNDGFSSITVNSAEALIIKTEDPAKVTWEATIDVSPSLGQAVVVKSKSSSGHTNNKASEFTINSLTLPHIFTIDTPSNRIIGNDNDKITTISLANSEVDYFNVDYSYVPQNQRISRDITYNTSRDLVVLSDVNDNKLIANTVSMSTKSAIAIVYFDLSQHYADLKGAFLNDILYVEKDDAVYFLVELHLAQTKLAIYKFNFVNSELSLYMTASALDSYLAINQIDSWSHLGRLAHHNNSLYFTGVNDIIFTVSNETRIPKIFTRTYGAPPKSFNINSNSELGYFITNAGVNEVDLVTGQIKTVSHEANEETLKINYFIHTAIDQKDNQLLVRDWTSDTLIAINLTTGSRTEAYTNGIGEGRKLTTPTDIAYSKANNSLYVSEDESGVIFAINLSTGDREVLLEFPRSDTINDLLFNEEANKLYILLRNSIVVLNILTQQANRITPSTSQSIFTGFDLDKLNNRLLITDTYNSSLIALNLDDSSIKAISNGFGDHEGGTISAADVKLDAKNSTAFVLSQSLGAIFKVDLTTNEKSMILDSCLTTYNEEILAAGSWGLEQLFLDPSNQTLYFVSDASVGIYDINQGTCSAPRAGVNSSFFDISATAENQLIGSYFNKIKQLDLENGQHVIISK